jgi:hypothetical protein
MPASVLKNFANTCATHIRHPAVRAGRTEPRPMVSALPIAEFCTADDLLPAKVANEWVGSSEVT